MSWNPPRYTKKIITPEKKIQIFDDAYYKKFLKDAESTREHSLGPKAVHDAVFNDRYKYVFYRAGRKGAKTTTGIEVGWRFAIEKPKSVGYLCYPTIAQGIEVVWEERRLQTYDRKDDYMYDQYIEKTDDSRHIIWFANGSYIKLVGTWTEARGRGTQPDWMVYDEFQDCNPEYIEAMDPNLAAKDAPCVFLGTPPKKRNHYEEWWDRVGANSKGKTFHFTSYDNINLPHLKDWLDNKKAELIKANKEDVWLREYMAELCYASSDRVLPDVKFIENEEMLKNLSKLSYSELIPILAISVSPSYFQAILGVQDRVRGLFILMV